MKRKGNNGPNIDEEVQNVEEKQWENEQLRILEEELPRLKECHLEEASRLF